MRAHAHAMSEYCEGAMLTEVADRRPTEHAFYCIRKYSYYVGCRKHRPVYFSRAVLNAMFESVSTTDDHSILEQLNL